MTWHGLSTFLVACARCLARSWSIRGHTQLQSATSMGRSRSSTIATASTRTTLPPASAEPPTALAFDIDGKRLLVVSPRAGVTAFDLATGERLLAPASIGTVALAFTPDGRRIVTASRSSLEVRTR